MRSTVKTRSPLSASNAKKLEELCAWISENSQQALGFSQLIQQSGFTKEQLVELFQLYKQMTPLAFVRKVRQQHKRSNSLDSQPQLFDHIKNSVNDSDDLTLK